MAILSLFTSIIIRSYGMNPENHRNVISAASFFLGLTSPQQISSIRNVIVVMNAKISSLENNFAAGVSDTVSNPGNIQI